mmetsp:Transcript_15688/g.24012  ORF Transcript_15688/g.24012 Transcript_15688/m.24012 type:complete len:314 (+) Transcript_15688:124-1065(+)
MDLPDSNSLGSSLHVVLLGDSILDNHRYVKSHDPAVIDQLRNKLQELHLSNVRSTLCAVDGARTVDLIRDQIETIPDDVTHILLSIGGNDGLKSLRQVVFDSSNWLPWRLYAILMRTKSNFDAIYREALQKIKQKSPQANIIACTIYYPVFPHNAVTQAICNVGINIMSSVIIKNAMKYTNIPIIDLRHVFNHKEDYANSIEPGVPGGDKLINNAIDIIRNHDFNRQYSTEQQLIYKSQKYSDTLKPQEYKGKYWNMQNVKEQQGSAATIFFRRAFDERENDNIKFYSKLLGALLFTCGAGAVYWRYGKHVLL